MFVACGTNELQKAFVRAKGWWRRNRLSDRWEKLGLSERMPVKNHYHNGNDVHSALGTWW